MRLLLLALVLCIFALLACTGTVNPAANACPTTDDAGAFEGTLFNLTDAGVLTINFDAGNGGFDLGPENFADGGGLGHVYEWPCIATYDCQTPRDASITFGSPNGVSDWHVLSMNYGTGADCITSVADAGPPANTNCCVACGPESVSCQQTCISIYDSCPVPACTNCN